jgi:hypothetical protein
MSISPWNSTTTTGAAVPPDTQVDVVDDVGSMVMVPVADSTARYSQYVIEVVSRSESEDMASFPVASSKESETALGLADWKCRGERQIAKTKPANRRLLKQGLYRVKPSASNRYRTTHQLEAPHARPSCVLTVTPKRKHETRTKSLIGS